MVIHLCHGTECGAATSVCCIYHKPKAFDESSDEDSSDSDSDSCCDHSGDGRSHRHLDRAQPSRGGDRDGGMQQSRSSDGTINEIQKSSEPNAYEKAKYKGKRKDES
ncbi:hypothetical protein HGRIS_004450 [Hohenbuehelia grisea]|uniref:Uncharacterized protein n=1 Tax=Hohenbuehelia grisea TaxID=104357 RepID=A0ABR3JBW6_9AGAR